jgi:hypothetical protein
MAPYIGPTGRNVPKHKCPCGKGSPHIGPDPTLEFRTTVESLLVALEGKQDDGDWFHIAKYLRETLGATPIQLLPQKAGEKKP